MAVAQGLAVAAYDVDMPREKGISARRAALKRAGVDYPHNPFATGIVAYDVPKACLGIALHRSSDNAPVYTRRDARMMELLRPHLVQTVKTVLLNEELKKYKSLTEALAQAATAMVLADPHMRVIWLNAAGAELLHVEPGKLLPADLADTLRKELARYRQPGGAELLTTSAVDLTFHSLPQGVYWLNAARVEGGDGEDCLLLRLNPAVEPYSRLRWLLQTKGLTDREVEVCGLVRRGMENREIAERLFISPLTVKTHLRAIHDKLGVNNRTKLMSLLSGE